MIRSLRLQDAVELREVQQVCFNENWSLSQWQRQFEQPRRILLGVESEGLLIGYAIFSYLLDEAELLQVAVLPEYRGQRWAEKQLVAAIEKLAENSVVRVMLEVRQSNLQALRLYQRLGFITDGKRKGYYPTENGREDAVLMSLSI